VLDIRSGTAWVGTSSVASCATRPFDPLRLGRLVHAIQARHPLALKQLRDGFVRGDHQMLDQPVGTRSACAVDRGDVAALVELELGLGRGRRRARRCAPARAGSLAAAARAAASRRGPRLVRALLAGEDPVDALVTPGARPSGSPSGRTRRSRNVRAAQLELDRHREALAPRTSEHASFDSARGSIGATAPGT